MCEFFAKEKTASHKLSKNKNDYEIVQIYLSLYKNILYAHLDISHFVAVPPDARYFQYFDHNFKRIERYLGKFLFHNIASKF